MCMSGGKLENQVWIFEAIVVFQTFLSIALDLQPKCLIQSNSQLQNAPLYNGVNALPLMYQGIS